MQKFRITFSTDVDKHYGPQAEDTTLSVTLVGRSFKEVQAEAEAWLKDVVFHPEQFDVVGVTRMEN